MPTYLLFIYLLIYFRGRRGKVLLTFVRLRVELRGLFPKQVEGGLNFKVAGCISHFEVVVLCKSCSSL